MFSHTFYDVLSKEGVVSIVTWTNETVHVANTWNSSLKIVGDKIYIPAIGYYQTEQNIAINDQVMLTIGSKEVLGKTKQGTGFLIDGVAKFITGGPVFDSMIKMHPNMRKALEITVVKATQTI